MPRGSCGPRARPGIIPNGRSDCCGPPRGRYDGASHHPASRPEVTMARKKTMSAPQSVKAEDGSSELEKAVAAVHRAQFPARCRRRTPSAPPWPRGSSRPATGGLHPQAVRPGDVQGALLRDEIEAEVGRKRGREGGRSESRSQGRHEGEAGAGGGASAGKARGRGRDILLAIEAMKPRVAALGAEKVKRIADLLGLAARTLICVEAQCSMRRRSPAVHRDRAEPAGGGLGE